MHIHWVNRLACLVPMLFAVTTWAQQAPETRASAPSVAAVPWRGSRLFYGHSFSALTVAPGAEPRYNPYYAHRLEMLPEWHVGNSFFVRGRVELSQELTVSDTTRYVREFVFSDSYLQAGLSGITVPQLGGIRIWPSFRVTLPTSKLSHARTLMVALGPGVFVSKTFPVLSGLSLTYAARYTERLHRLTTAQNEGSALPSCTDLRSVECLSLTQTGQRNTARDVLHGPNVALQVTPRLWVNTAFNFSHAWRYGLPAAPSELPPLPSAQDNALVSATQFALEVGWAVSQGMGLALGTSTFSMQPNPYTGLRQNPFFNRSTTLYLDFGIDIEGLLSRN